jgi:hypothetical protein
MFVVNKDLFTPLRGHRKYINRELKKKVDLNEKRRKKEQNEKEKEKEIRSVSEFEPICNLTVRKPLDCAIVWCLSKSLGFTIRGVTPNEKTWFPA